MPDIFSLLLLQDLNCNDKNLDDCFLDLTDYEVCQVNAVKFLNSGTDMSEQAVQSERGPHTNPSSSVGIVFAPGNRRCWVRSQGHVPKSLKMVLAAPCLALRLTG